MSEERGIKRGRGRPKENNIKEHRKVIRLTNEEKKRLDYICEKMHISSSQAMRNALFAEYNYVHSKYENLAKIEGY